MKIKLALIATVALLLSACDNAVYLDCKELPHSEWAKDSVCVFEFPITETQNTYQIQLIVRNNDNYPNQNLWLFIDQTTPNGTCTKDTTQLFLADEFGRWTGSGAGSLFENVFIYREHITYKTPGTYKIAVKQAMRYETLDGISDFGVKIIKTK